MSYERSDDEGELEMVPIVNNNFYNYNVVSDSESDNENEEIIFDEDIHKEVKVTPKTTINT